MRSAEYWKKRAISVMEAGMASADKVLLELEKAYTRAEKQVLGQIESLYARYAGKYGLTYDQAVKSIADSEYRQWRMTVEDYVGRILATGDEELLREFDTLSTRSRVARLEQVEAAIKVNVAELRAKQEQMVTKLLHSTYEKSYYRTAFDIQKGLGFGKTLELLNPVEVANACAYPWSGASFSSRIWTNMDALSRELKETITVGLIRGTSIDEMARNIRDKMDVSFSAAERIIRTETARVVEDAELQSYKDCGIEKYEVLVQLDERTCKTCGPKDGQQHAVKDAQMGENYPPFHPNCRCTTVAVFDDLDTEGSMRAAKEGKSDYRLVPADMTFEEWKKEIVRRSEIIDREAVAKYDKIVKQYITIDAVQVLAEARKGVRHGGLYREALTKQRARLKKSIISHALQVEEHAAKLANPRAYDAGWDLKTQRQKEGLLRKWEKDLRRNAEQETIECAVWKERFE
ncbi:MAG: minor capsid protein [Christensenellales bacterium]|jgi:SPP1 gp7 family putative phage head morphogenesis protein